MCLYPRLIFNPKYKRNKKNGGVIPVIPDKRVQMVPIGCQTCIECRKQKATDWQTRLQEDIKEHADGKFITLTFSTEKLRELYNELKNPSEKVDKKTGEMYVPKIARVRSEKFKNLKGYEVDNYIVTYAVRSFLERWRKKNQKSLRHWLITELGDGTTEHIHLHGIVWTDKVMELESIWQYGTVWWQKYIFS